MRAFLLLFRTIEHADWETSFWVRRMRPRREAPRKPDHHAIDNNVLFIWRQDMLPPIGRQAFCSRNGASRNAGRNERWIDGLNAPGNNCERRCSISPKNAIWRN